MKMGGITDQFGDEEKEEIMNTHKKTFSDFKMSDYVEGQHDFIHTTLFKGHPWTVCVWCQKFKSDVKNKPCTGAMKVHLN